MIARCDNRSLWLTGLIGACLFASACQFRGAGSNNDSKELDSGVVVDTGPQPDAFDPTSVPFKEGFTRRKLVTIDNAGGPELTDFPLAIDLGALDSLMGSQGRELCATTINNETLLATEVEFFDNGTVAEGVAVAWVEVSMAADSQHLLWLYDGQTGNASDMCGAEERPSPFGSFDGVFHFSDIWDSGNPVRNSGSGPDLDLVNEMESDDPTDFEVERFARAPKFDRTAEENEGEFFSTNNRVTAFQSPPNTAILYEAMFKAPPDGASRAILDANDNQCEGFFLKLTAAEPTSGQVVGGMGLGPACQGTAFSVTSDQTYDDNAWHHAALLVDRASPMSSITLYVDGVRIENTVEFPDTADAQSGVSMHVGYDATSNAQDFVGLIDEVRIGRARDAGWIGATARFGLESTHVTVGAPAMSD